MIVGVGGQGVMMISKVMALIGQRQGLQVKQSEVHGMAKRGGIVFSHVRFGKEVWSPTIAKGDADALIALEWAEGLRWLDHLKPETGVFIADTRRIVPPFACRSRKHGATTNYARETPAEIVSRIADGYALDATSIADELGDVRAANTVLLGALSVSLDYPVADWLAVIEELVPKRTREINRKAFEAGRAWAEAARADPSCASTSRSRGGRRPRAAPRGVVRGHRQRRLVQGLRHLRQALPGALPCDVARAGRHRRSTPRPAPAAMCANGCARTSPFPSKPTCVNPRPRDVHFHFSRFKATRPARWRRSPPAAASSPATRSRPPPRSPNSCRANCRASMACSSRWRTRSPRSPR